jgi:hypothetical protein
MVCSISLRNIAAIFAKGLLRWREHHRQPECGHSTSKTRGSKEGVLLRPIANTIEAQNLWESHDGEHEHFFWYVAPCSPEGIDQRLSGACCLHHKSTQWWQGNTFLGPSGPLPGCSRFFLRAVGGPRGRRWLAGRWRQPSSPSLQVGPLRNLQTTWRTHRWSSRPPADLRQTFSSEVGTTSCPEIVFVGFV